MCYRCKLGEQAVKAREAREERAQKQLEAYVTWDHKNFPFRESRQKDDSWDCIVEVDGNTAKMRITRKRSAKSQWRGIWWEPRKQNFYEPEDWAEHTVTGDKIADVRERLISLVSEEYGEQARVRVMPREFDTARRTR